MEADTCTAGKQYDDNMGTRLSLLSSQVCNKLSHYEPELTLPSLAPDKPHSLLSTRLY